MNPEDDSLMLCERVDVASLDEQGLEARLIEFVKHAAFWSSEAISGLLGPQPDPAPSVPFQSEHMIRL